MRPRTRNSQPINQLLILFLFLLPSASRAVDFAGGTGEPNDPYQIATAEQLLAIHGCTSGKHFSLINDIDMDPGLPTGEVFRGVLIGRGCKSGRFAGVFHGNDFSILNLVMDGANKPVALFDVLESDAMIMNLHLENVLVLALEPPRSFQGVLAMENHGMIRGCSVTGTVVGNATLTGGLVGSNTGTVQGCYSACLISGRQVGGLVSENTGTLLSCQSEGTVYASGLAGGLVGSNGGTVFHCRNEAAVFGEGIAGGVAGSNRGRIHVCTSFGMVQGEISGGLAGSNENLVLDSYVTGTVSGYRYVGGLVGWNEDGHVANSYMIGDVRGSMNGGLLIGFCEGGSVASCHALLPVDHRVERLFGGYRLLSIRNCYLLGDYETDFQAANTRITYLTSEQMLDSSNFGGLDFYGDANDGQGDSWYMPESSYPILSWQTEAITGLVPIPVITGESLVRSQSLLEAFGFQLGDVTYDYFRLNSLLSCTGRIEHIEANQVAMTYPQSVAPAGTPVNIVVSLGPYYYENNSGDGTVENPYQIASAGQMEALAYLTHLEDQHFVMMDHIDLTGRQYREAIINRLSGTFDGHGYSAIGLYVDWDQQHASGYGGMFGIIADPNAVVRNLRIEGARVYDCGGILAGQNYGSIINCSVSGVIVGKENIGGVIGINSGVVSGCYADTAVSGSSVVGGIVGENHGISAVIANCYSRGSVVGERFAGGLVGRNTVAWFGRPERYYKNPGVIMNSYSICSVEGVMDIGGLLGGNDPNGVVSGCYFLGPDDGGGPDNGLGMPVPEWLLKQPSKFMDWDFDGVWMICEGDYPRLQWEGIQCDPALSATMP